jgi:multimeric flavodoxin WrbA
MLHTHSSQLIFNHNQGYRMTTIAVIYHSVTGTTQQLAEAIAEGVNDTNTASALMLSISGKDIVDGRFVNHELLAQIDSVDGVAFGSPTYMGCVSAQFKAFADATGEIWCDQVWANKVAAGFTIGSNYSGDQLNTIQYLNTFANQHGMLWVGLDIPGGYDPQGRNRLGAQCGVIAQTTDTNVHETDLATARHLGKRVAGLASAV